MGARRRAYSPQGERKPFVWRARKHHPRNLACEIDQIACRRGASIGVFTAYIDAGTDSSTYGRLRAVTMIAVITGSTASAVSTSTAATRPGAKAEHESTISDRAVHTWPDPRSGSRCAPCMANSPG